MSRWFEHPITSKTLEDDQVLNVLSLINEAKNIFNIHFGDPNSNVSPLDDILKLWPVKTHVKKEWLRRVLDNGPMTDMIQSMGVVISEFPMHSLYYIDRLISLVNLNKKRFAITSSELLTNIFDKFLLPKTRPLINFNERPLKILNTLKIKSEKDKKELPPKDRILSFWYFEEQLKTRYIRFLKALEELIKNEPDGTNKIKIVNLLHRLCKHKESQTVILGILVNKLGDKNKKVAGSAFSKLTDLGYEKDKLLSKIVRSVRRFVFRPNLSKKAQYYAVQLLTRSKINKHNMIAEPDVADEADTSGIVTDNIAVELVQIYIGVFKRLVDNSKSKCDKLYSASLVTNNDDILNKAIILNCSSDISMGSLCQDQIMHNTTPNESFSDRSVNIDRIHSNLSSNRDKNKSDINQYNCASNQSIGADDPNIDQLKINSTINEFSIFKNRFLASEYSKESYYDKFSIFEGIDGNLCYNKEEDKFNINQYSHASQQSIGAEDSNISLSEIGGTLIQSFPAIQGIPEQLESRQFTGDISTQHLTDRKSTNWSLFNIEAHSKKYITNPDDSIQFDEMNSVERIRNNKSGSITDFTFDLNNSVRKTFPSTSFDQVPNRNTFRTPINALNIDRNYTSCFASGRKQNEHINQMTPITAVYQIQSNKKQNTIIGSQSKYYNLKLLISSIKSQEKKLDIDLLYDEFFSIDNIHRFNHDLLTVSKKDRDSIISDLKPHSQLCSYPEINQLYLKHIGNPILKVMEFSKTQVQTLCKKFLEKLEKINKLKMKLLITCFFCKRQQLCKHQNELKILTQQIVEDMKINYNFCLREVSMSYNYSLKSGMESFKLEVAKLNIGMRNIIAERQSNKQRIENDRKLALIESRLKQADLLVSSALKMTEMDRVKQALMEKTYSKTPERKKEDYLRFIIDRKTSPFRATHLTNSSMKFSLMGSRVNIIATVRDNGGPEEICIESATVTAEPTLAPMHLCIEAYFQTLVNQYLINRTTDYAKNFLLHHQQPILLLFADVNMCQKYKYLAIYFEPGDSFMLKAQIMSNSPLARFAVLIDLNPISTYHHRLLNYQLEIDYNNVDDSKIRQIIDTTGHGLNKLYRLFDKLFNELSSIVLTL